MADIAIGSCGLAPDIVLVAALQAQMAFPICGRCIHQCDELLGQGLPGSSTIFGHSSPCLQT
jgi:hypothetical protein